MFSRLCSIVTNTCTPVFNKGTTSTNKKPSIVPKLLIPGDHLSIIKIGKVDKNKQFYVSYLHNGKINTWVVQIHSNCYLRMLENENFEEILNSLRSRKQNSNCQILYAYTKKQARVQHIV